MIRTKPLVLSRPIRRRWTPFSDLFGNPFRPGHEQWRRYSLKSSMLRLCCETLFHIHMIPVTLLHLLPQLLKVLAKSINFIYQPLNSAINCNSNERIRIDQRGCYF